VYSVIPTILDTLGLVLYLGISVVLVLKYFRTRDAGFIWLGVAIVIWPLVSRLLVYGELVFVDRLVHGHAVGFFPFSLVERQQMSAGFLINSLNLTQQLIGACLLLIAVLSLSRAKSAAIATQQPNHF